jgi:predicted ATPase/DNA-binding CsgD family transcriptional regulator
MGDGRSPELRGISSVRLTRLFGRRRAVSELRTLMGEEQVLTLVGPPGGGKTRLGTEVGLTLADQFPGGIWFVELAPVVDPDHVATAVGVAMGLRQQPGREMVDTLVDNLSGGDGSSLLVLDNCEHVVDAARRLVETLTGSCPRLRVLATSRAPLAADRERVWPVPPLEREPAVDLFLDRAAAASAGFRLDPAGEAIVGDICDRLDRLPLAIELAAAWTRVLSLPQIADRLTEAVQLRGGPERDERHRTMTSTVDWSYRLLPAPAQRLFERLSVFADGFDLEAVEAVAAPADDALSSLAVLIDHSLVLASAPTPTGPMRYHLLEPVRQAAEAKLRAHGGGEEAQRLHAEHYLAVALRFDPYGLRQLGRISTLVEVAPEESNFLAALDWAITQPTDLGLRLAEALGYFWEYGGRINLGLAWLDALLARHIDDPIIRSQALTWAAKLAWRQGDYEHASHHFEEALALVDAAGDRVGRSRVLITMLLVTWTRGDSDRAIGYGEEALALAIAAGDERLAMFARLNLAWAHYSKEEVVEGDSLIQTALTSPYADNPTAIAAAVNGLQYGAYLVGDTRAQRAYLARGLEAKAAGGVFLETDWLGNCAAMASLEGRSEATIRLIGGLAYRTRVQGSHPPTQIVARMMDTMGRAYAEIGPRSQELALEGEAMSWDELVAEGLAVATPARSADPRLTPRQAEVVQLIAQGLSNVDIARKLTISRRTVETHVDQIKRKLDLRTRHELMAWSLRSEDP